MMESYPKLQEAEKILRKYAAEHAGKPEDKECDPMAAACMVAADTLKQITGNGLWVADVKMESIMTKRKFHADCLDPITEKRLKFIEDCEREAANDLMHDVLYSGLVRTSSNIDPTSGDLTVMADTIVGVLGGEDVNEMLIQQRDYYKFHVK